MERCQLDIALEYDQNGYKALASKDGREPEDDLKKRPRRVNVLVACPPGPEQTAESAGFCSQQLRVEPVRVLANRLYLHVAQGAEIGSLTLMHRDARA